MKLFSFLLSAAFLSLGMGQGEALESQKPEELWQGTRPYEVAPGQLRPLFLTLDRGTIQRKEDGRISLDLQGPIDIGGICSQQRLTMTTRSVSSSSLVLNESQSEADFIAQASRVGKVEKVEHEEIYNQNRVQSVFEALSNLIKITLEMPFSPAHRAVFYKNAQVTSRQAQKDYDCSMVERAYGFLFGGVQQENPLHLQIIEKLNGFFASLELKEKGGSLVTVENFRNYLGENLGVAYRYAPLTEDLVRQLRSLSV